MLGIIGTFILICLLIVCELWATIGFILDVIPNFPRISRGSLILAGVILILLCLIGFGFGFLDAAIFQYTYSRRKV